jgi:hypothetical protein
VRQVDSAPSGFALKKSVPTLRRLATGLQVFGWLLSVTIGYYRLLTAYPELPEVTTGLLGGAAMSGWLILRAD